MAVYQVLRTPRPIERPDRSGAVFVPDRFSWSAMLLTPFWMLAHGLWLELVFWIACALVLVVGSAFIGGEAAFWLGVLISMLIGFEAAAIRTASLLRRGYRREGDLVAGAPEFAERDWLLRERAA